MDEGSVVDIEISAPVKGRFAMEAHDQIAASAKRLVSDGLRRLSLEISGRCRGDLPGVDAFDLGHGPNGAIWFSGRVNSWWVRVSLDILALTARVADAEFKPVHHDSLPERAGAFVKTLTTEMMAGVEGRMDGHGQPFSSSLFGEDFIEFGMGVTPTPVSKWRTRWVPAPAENRAFLTLLLASWVEELEELKRARLTAGRPVDWLEGPIKEARRSLREQEGHNSNLPTSAIIRGVRMFQKWWHTNGKKFAALSWKLDSSGGPQGHRR